MGRFLLVLLVVVLIGAGVLYVGVTSPYFGTTGETFVEIAPGSGSQQIARQLQQAGVVRSQYFFDAVRMLKRTRLQAGEYRFDHAASVAEVYDRIHRGDVYTIAVVVPEGFNLYDIAQVMEGAGLMSRQEFLRAAKTQTALIGDISPHAESLEGYLFPDTYRFPHKVTGLQVVTAMVKRFRVEATRLGLAADPPAEIARVVTLASLIEKETGASEERTLVASVFENRLEKGIPLATDPSVIYAALLEGRYRGTIYASDLKNDSAYNTYLHAGLPPGPIANAGVASFKAAMHPAATDYLYFVSDGAGHSVFSATLAEHDKNVAAYRETEKAAGRR
jgi:UPF0755 protein